MRATRDSFLRFLADNLPVGTNLHSVRRDPSKPDSDRLRVNAVNVKFLDVLPARQHSESQVEIAVLHEDELSALSLVNSVYGVLGARYFTPRLDYTNPAAPVATGSNIYWDRDIRFRSVTADGYHDYRCLLTLRHTV